MWMSNILIVIDPKNADRNTLFDLANAATEAGAQVITVDENRYVIEAAIPSQYASIIAAMDGVAYVRSVFTYHCNPTTPQAA
jgi:hypothetical protein